MADMTLSLPKNLPAGAVMRPLVRGLPKGATLRSVPRGTRSDIGTFHEESGRPVLHDAKRPGTIQRLATEEHDDVKALIGKAISGVKGASISGNREEKDPERVAEKVEGGQAPHTVRDYSGFRIAVDNPQAWKQSAMALRSAFHIPDEQDAFEMGSELNFHGHTLQVKLPASKVSHEVQILPREVAEHADADHELYERSRTGDRDAEQELKDRNRQHYVDFLDRNGTAKYKFGNTQAMVPPESEAARAVDAVRQTVKASDLAGDGKDIDANHVTVRYGVQGGDARRLRDFLRRQAPFTARLGPTTAFPASKHSDGAAVIVSPVLAPELHRLNSEITKHGDFAPSSFPDYRPHVTVAYVKPLTARKYSGLTETAGKPFRIDSVQISYRDGSTESVQLAGSAGESDDVRKATRGDSVPTSAGSEVSADRGRAQLGKTPFSDGSAPNGAALRLLPALFQRGLGIRPAGGADLRRHVSEFDPSIERRAAPGAGLFQTGEPETGGNDWGSASAVLLRQSGWRKNDRFLLRNPQGGFDSGIVKYWNPGYNGASPTGRSHINGGLLKQDGVPTGAIPVVAELRLLQPATGTDGEAEVMGETGPLLPAYVADYLVRNTSEGISIIATDSAKRLIPSFAADPIRTDRAICSSAAAIRDGALETLLGVAPDPLKNELLMVVGSPGSGKTTGMVFGGARPGTSVYLEAIPDNPDNCRMLLQQILDAGRRPVIEWVWVDDPVTTVRRMVDRALGTKERRGIGRTVAVAYMAKAWVALQQVLPQMKREFGDRIDLYAVDNSGPLSKTKVIPTVPKTKLAEDDVLEQLRREIYRMDAAGRFAGEDGQAVKTAALSVEPGIQRRELVRAPETAIQNQFATALKRSQAIPGGTLRAEAQAAWQRAAEAFESDPRLQVPF